MMNLLIVFLLGDSELHFLVVFLFGGGLQAPFSPSSIFLMFFLFGGSRFHVLIVFFLGKSTPNKKTETGVPKEKTLITFSMESSQIVLLFLFLGIQSPKTMRIWSSECPKGKTTRKWSLEAPKRKNIKNMKMGVAQRENR